jgi:hypothetical protein
MVRRKLLNVAEKFHRHSAGRTVYCRHILGPLSDLDVQWWRVAARHDASRCVTVAADLTRRSVPSLRPHRDFPRLVGVEHVVLGAAHLRL